MNTTPAASGAAPALPTDAQINEARQRHGVTSNGRGIKEFTQVADFAREIAALASREATQDKLLADLRDIIDAWRMDKSEACANNDPSNLVESTLQSCIDDVEMLMGRSVADLASPQVAPALTRDQIRAVFLANGFTVKEGQTDLKPYVYDAAAALLAFAAPVQVAPAGFKLVPLEPTEAMFTRFAQQIETGVVYVGGFLQAYRCMLDAAPATPMQAPAAADDARDAADQKEDLLARLVEVICDHLSSLGAPSTLVHAASSAGQQFIDRHGWAERPSSTPAAKPAEEQS